MLEEKEARSSADAGQPKASKTAGGTGNPAAGKTTDGASNGGIAIAPARRFALRLERGPPPLTSPLLGGLPASSLLIGQRAASLRLAQLKAQLALTQISNSLAVGGRAANLTAESKAPAAPHVHATAPSPTAAAINLLNLLKIANTMSHPLYNPYASGNQGSAQGQYRLPREAERDPQRAPPQFGPGSGFGSSGASSATPASSAGMIPPLVGQSANYRSEQSRAAIDEDIERSIDMHISRAREEVRYLGKPAHQPVGQGARYAGSQRDEFVSSGAGASSYPASSSSAPLGRRQSDAERSSGSLDWLPGYKRSAADDSSKFYSAAASSSYAGGSESRFDPPGDAQSIPGLGDYDYPVPDKPAAPAEASRPKYTSESATNILLHFGLEKEDLEQLISYPEDQITPANLPFILRQIRIKKASRAVTVAQAEPYPDPQPTRAVTGVDSLSGPGAAVMRQEDISSAVLQPSKIIDYGHTGKYTAGILDDIGRAGGRRVNSDSSGSASVGSYDGGSHGREPQQKEALEVKSSVMASSRDQGGSSQYSSVLSSAPPPTNNPAQRPQPQQNQTFQSNFGSFPVAKKAKARRVFTSEPPKHFSFKESEPKTQPPTGALHGTHPDRPGLVLIGSGDASGATNQSKTQGKGLVVAEQVKNLQATQPTMQPRQQTVQAGQQAMQPTMQLGQQTAQPTMQPGQQMMQQSMQPSQQTTQPVAQQRQQTKQPTPQQKPQPAQQQVQKQPLSHMGQGMWPLGLSAAQPVPPASLLPGIEGASHAVQHPAFHPGDPRSMAVPPPPIQPVLSPLNFLQTLMTSGAQRRPSHKQVCKGPPTKAMMYDYAAASPKAFPHTCSLCYKECTHMKDWISHQNTGQHLGNCKVLRSLYPEWDGGIVPGSSVAAEDAKPSPSTSAADQTSQHRPKTGRLSPETSRKPRGSEGRRERRSRSRSPRSSRYARSSRSRSRSPRYDYPPSSSTTTRYRSRSRSYERRSPPRRREERERRPLPRRSEETWSSSRRRSDRRSATESSDDGWSSPRRSRDGRRSPMRSRERSSPQRRKSSNAERLAKKLLENSAVQSLSKESDLEAVVKSLAPALLAELAKMKSSSSSSSSSPAAAAAATASSQKGGKRPQAPASSPSAAKKKEATAAKPKTSLQKSERGAPAKTKPQLGKPSPPTIVMLKGVQAALSHGDVSAAVEQFGKAKSVVLIRSKLEAVVCFEKEEDAKKLRSAKNFSIKGFPVTVAVDKEVVPEEEKKPQKKPAASAAKPTKTPTAASPSPSEAKKAKPGKDETSKDPPRGNAAAAAKVPVPKGRSASTKTATPAAQKKQTAAAGGAAKMAVSGAAKAKPTAAAAEKAERLEETAADEPAAPDSAESKEPDPKVQQPEDKAEGVETGSAAVSGLKRQAEPDAAAVEAKRAKDQPAEVESCARPDPPPPEPPTAPPQNADAASVEAQRSSLPEPESTAPPEVKAEASSPAGGAEVKVEASSPAGGAEVKVEASRPAGGAEVKVEALPTQQLAASSPAGGAKVKVEASSPARGAEVKAELSSPAGGVKVKVEASSPAGGAEVKVEASPTQQRAASSPAGGAEVKAEASPVQDAPQVVGMVSAAASAARTLTVGEMVEERLCPNKISCLKKKTCFSPKFFNLGKKVLMITDLPPHHDGCYTEEEVAGLLAPFGFKHKDESIYVVPQARVAFFSMPSVDAVHAMLKDPRSNRIRLKQSRLTLQVVAGGVTMSQLGFYKSLMKRMCLPVFDDGERTVLVKNISPSDARALRESLRKIGFKNFLPLLNKVYVEFQSHRDADRLGVWYSLLRRPLAHTVHRLKTPRRSYTAPPPRLAATAMPAQEDVVAGVTVPTARFGVPQGSMSPFWVMLPAPPFLFPTVSPWFIIPDYLTVRGNDDIVKVNRRGSVFPTVMLTGLPEDDYGQEDVARLVWSHLPAQNLRTLYYSVTVLTLQRRAFVHFGDWTACCAFARRHIADPVSVGGCPLTVHFVLEDVSHETTEELMYASLMKWSNARVPDAASLEERLLCVEVSSADVSVVTAVMGAVASVAPFVGFLPLANRICVEMADPVGVAQVLEDFHAYSPDAASKDLTWSKVKRFETLRSFKRRLQESGDTAIKLEPDPVAAEAEPAAPPPPPEPPGDGSRPAAAAPEPSAEDDGEKPGAADDSAAAPEAVEAADAAADGNPAPAAPGPGGPAASQGSKVIYFDQEAMTTLMAAVREHRLAKRHRTRAKESPGRSGASSAGGEDEPQEAAEAQQDFTDDTVSSDALLFDQQDFNMDDFVTVDEVGEDAGEDAGPSSPERKERRSRGVAPAASPAASPSPEKARGSSELAESSAKPSASSSSSPSPAETPPSPARRSKAAASGAASSGCRTRSSSARASSEASEGAVATCDHRVSAEGTAAKSAESEAGTETCSEMRPPARRGEWSQNQNQNQNQHQNPGTDFGDKPAGDAEASADDGGEKYQILDQVDDGSPAGGSGPETGQTSRDPVDGEGEKEADARLQAADDSGDKTETLANLDEPGDEAAADKERETKDHDDGVETGSRRAAAGDEDMRRQEEEQEEVKSQMTSSETSKASDHVEKPRDVPGQETFEILDSIDDQAAGDEDVREPEPPGGRASKGDAEEDEDASRVVDSVEDKKTKNGDASGPSKRSGAGTRRQDRTLRKYDTRTRRDAASRKDEEVEEYQIVDSVEDEPVHAAAAAGRPGRRRSARVKKEEKTAASGAPEKPDGDEEVSFKILDSVEDEAARSTRGRRERPARREDTPTRRRHAPAGESTPTRKGDEEDATYRVLDSVEEEAVAKEVRLATGGRGRRGRPKKEARVTRRGAATLRKADEEEVSYRILDSLEEEAADDGAPAGRTEEKTSSTADDERGKRSAGSPQHEEEEEEPVYQIVDSLEEEQEVTYDRGTEEKNETKEEEEEAPAVTEQRAGGDEESGEERKEAKGKPTTWSRGDTAPPAKKKEQKQTSTLVNLDQVSEEEEDYPDDTAEEEELRRRQAAAKQRQLAEERERRRTREKEQQSRSSGKGGGVRKAQEEEEEEEEEEELVTLDEVGADEAGEAQRHEWEGELQALVTLDEIVEEEEEEEEEERRVEGGVPPEPRPPSEEDQSERPFQPETLVTRDEEEEKEEEEEEEEERTLRSTKRKHSDHAEESVKFVTVDEVGEEEEEEEEVEEERRSRTRGRGRKRSRQTPVRKSTRAKKPGVKNEREEEEKEPPPPAPLLPAPQDVPESQEEEAAAAAAEEGGGADPRTENTSTERGEEDERRRSGADIKAAGKRTSEPTGSEAKRSRSRSPSVPVPLKLPPFDPKRPLGREFVVPKSGFFCNLCAVFYLSESAARDAHCSSRRHYDNLQKHYQKLQQNPPRARTGEP